jgi:hypothetical protein
MGAYSTVVDGTAAGSSLRAVDPRGQIPPHRIQGSLSRPRTSLRTRPHAAAILKEEGYKTTRNAPIYAILRGGHR